MLTLLKSWLQPLMLAGILAIASVALMLDRADSSQRVLVWALLAVFAGLFLLLEVIERRSRVLRDGALLTMLAAALGLISLESGLSPAPILLVIWVSVAAGEWPTRKVLLAALLANVVFYLLLRDHSALPMRMVAVYASFQLFGALCVHYAKRAEQARDDLARVNADLLATRVLLADSARGGERVRLARDLHDVAGHKLTALKLNLRALAADPALARRDEVQQAETLASELLEDIRGVVAVMREADGMDLSTALRALAAPFPRPRLQLQIADNVQITDPRLAEAIVRTVQEALTNSARHADAATIKVQLTRDGSKLSLRIEDDGKFAAPLHEGNGLAGMRERIEALHGELSFSHSAHGGLRIDATLPA